MPDKCEVTTVRWFKFKKLVIDNFFDSLGVKFNENLALKPAKFPGGRSANEIKTYYSFESFWVFKFGSCEKQ